MVCAWGTPSSRQATQRAEPRLARVQLKVHWPRSKSGEPLAASRFGSAVVPRLLSVKAPCRPECACRSRSARTPPRARHSPSSADRAAATSEPSRGCSQQRFRSSPELLLRPLPAATPSGLSIGKTTKTKCLRNTSASSESESSDSNTPRNTKDAGASPGCTRAETTTRCRPALSSALPALKSVIASINNGRPPGVGPMSRTSSQSPAGRSFRRSARRSPRR
mmetsp:Transcript_107526/g.334268  ORF Transcript_107526/g.334268 Transcript_107526/m.334268 type:complete len:222 (+) Transcript_107526:290-955(+)